jgi:tetratricopeptide (TPR) repeat protein
MRLALFALFLSAEIALAQAPKQDSPPPAAAKKAAGKADASWKGERVMSKSGVARLRKITGVDDDGEPIYAITVAFDPDYVVRDVQGDLVLLRSRNRNEGWIEKETLIPLKQAVEFFTKALEENPDATAINHQLRAHARQATGDLDGAIADISEAIRLEPDSAELFDHRAVLWTEKKDLGKALADIDEAVRLRPDSTHMLTTRGLIRMRKADYAGAAKDFDEAQKADDANPYAHNALAWLLATCPDADVRSGRRAVTHAEKAVELTERKHGAFLDTLAAAYAEVQRFDDAIRVQQEALGDREFLLGSGNQANERLELYRQRKAYREK